MPTIGQAQLGFVTRAVQLVYPTQGFALTQTIDVTALATEGNPSAESQEGKTFSWNPNASAMELRHPKIFFGPSSLSTGSFALVGNQANQVVSSVPADGIGFRTGLVAYPPRGRYGILTGQLQIQSSLTGVRFDVTVTQGTALGSTTQPNILSCTTTIVGYGSALSPATASLVFPLTFTAPDIQNASTAPQAAEILVSVFPQTTSTAAGTVLASVPASTAGGGSPNALASVFTLHRWDGLYGTTT